MDIKEINSRLLSLITDLGIKIEESTNTDIIEEAVKDKAALINAVNILKENLLLFDVARWSRLDIQSVMESQEVTLTTTEEIEDFVDDVILTLSDRFDASIGVNWDEIEKAVEEVKRGNGL